MEPYISMLNINEISGAEFRTAFLCMPEERRSRCELLRSEKDKKLCIAADMLVRKALLEKYAFREDEIVFEYGEAGKPYLRGNPLYFNISHSGDHAAAVFSEYENGIDIQKIVPVKKRLMKYFCTPDDIAYIFDDMDPDIVPDILDNEDVLKRFFEVWTFKEAFCKCSGKGFNSDILRVSFTDAHCYTEHQNGYVISTVYNK